MITIQCRDHGGTFQIQPKRGRRPVRCTRENACTRYASSPQRTTEGPPESWVPSRVEATASAIKNARMAVEGFNKAHPQVQHMATNPSVVLAMAAKQRLEAQGWLCKGRGWLEDEHEFATLTATRDEETIIMHWNDGQLIQQDYSLWHEAPSANGKPRGSLSFAPDECTDRELVRALAGCKVTWWNVLGQKEETAIIAPESIKIEHAYNGHGDETPGDRIVKFIEHGGAGYRAFRMAALLKVG